MPERESFHNKGVIHYEDIIIQNVYALRKTEEYQSKS